MRGEHKGTLVLPHIPLQDFLDNPMFSLLEGFCQEYFWCFQHLIIFVHYSVFVLSINKFLFETVYFNNDSHCQLTLNLPGKFAMIMIIPQF